MRFALVLLLSFLARAVGQDVRITEFMPVNTTGLLDQDGTPQPWIEIWNPNPSSKVVLTNWRLSHAGTQWTFPTDFEIPPDEYVVVFASGKNRVDPTAPLHTSFTLNSNGGATLQLLRNDSSVASTFANYPAVPANSSYGRDRTEVNVVGTYSSPTPGASNNYTGPGVAGKVTISVPPRAFTGILSVQLAQVVPSANAVIRYTLNGSVPTASSTQYSGNPISITSSVQLRARVFEVGKLPGETETAGYLLLDGTTLNFNTATPLIVVSNFGLGTFPDTGDQAAYMWVWEPGTNGRAYLSNLPTLGTRAAVDRRGSSTLGAPKTNFNLEARKSRDDDDRDISLLGMPQGADWVFHAPYEYDRSLLHNPFMYALSNRIGRQAMRTRMAEVFVETSGGTLNFTGGASGDYFGMYNVMEKVRRGNDRVDVTRLDPYDNDAVRKTGGYIFKVDRQDAGDTGFSAGQTMAYYYPKEVEIRTPTRDPQEQYLTGFMTSFNTALNSTNFTDPTTGYAAWMDVASAVEHHLLNVWSFNVDALRLSAYMHKDRGGKLVFGPIWDFDRALSSTDGRDANPATWRSQSTPDSGTDFFNHVWWRRMFADPDFYQKYIDRWVELRRTTFAPTSVDALLDLLNAELTSEGVDRDLARWGKAKRSWTSPFTNTVYPAGQAAEVQRIKDYLQQRANFMDSQWVGPVSADVPTGTVAPGTSVTLTAAPGSTIFYTLDGSDPRPSGGGAPTGGSSVTLYSGPIPVSGAVRIKARAYNPNWTALTGPNNPPLVSRWSGLTDVRYTTTAAATPATLAITEIQYNPVGPNAAELAVDPTFAPGDFEFIELKNVGSSAIDLGGVEISGGIRFTFTNDAATALEPGEYILIAGNSSALGARYGNVGKVAGAFAGDLSNTSDLITIKTASGVVVADFAYQDQWYPLTDGSGRSLEAAQPAPGNYASAAFWRASFRAQGSPGFEDVPVAISEQPTGATVNPGTLVQLSVIASGQPAPTYQWRRNGEALQGETNAAYTIAAAQEGDEGMYDGVVSNIGGSVVSDAVSVSVNDPVNFTSHPQSQTVNPNATVTFSVQVTGTGPFSYQWRKNGAPLDVDSTPTLEFAANEEAEGTYDVQVTNPVGTVTSDPAVLVVNDPVMITEFPQGTTVNPGAPVMLQVKATGTQPLTFQWLRNGQEIPGETADTLSFTAAEALEDMYAVKVTNIVNTETTAGVMVAVNDPITITLQPQSRVVRPDGSARFEVAAIGTAPLQFQWRRNEEPIPGANGTVLEIASVGESNLGTYDVVVGNVVGNVESDPATLAFVDWQIAARRYQGILTAAYETPAPAEKHVGRVTASLSKTGKYTGKVEFAGLQATFKGELNLNLQAEETVVFRDAPSLIMTIFYDGVEQRINVEAWRVGQPGESWRTAAAGVEKHSARAPSPQRGRYTVLLTPQRDPSEAAPGFLLLNVATSGSAAWTGRLPDGGRFVGSAWGTADQALAVYSAPYGNRAPKAGHVAGRLPLSSVAFTSEFSWHRPAQRAGEAALAELLTADGAPYVPPPRNTRVLPFPSVQLRLFSAIGLLEPVATLGTNNRFDFGFPNTLKWKMAVKTATGELQGSYFDAFANKTWKLHGIIMQPQNRGAGFGFGRNGIVRWELVEP
jgi:hypothetical protein